MKILITQNHLSDYAGSEIITLELASYFSSHEWHVDILTNIHGPPIDLEFSKIKGVRVITDENNLKLVGYDLVWIHHQLIPSSLFDELSSKTGRPAVVFNHMSPYEPFEYPRNVSLENSLADMVLANSEETKKMLIEAGVKKGLIEVLGNPAPDEFLRKKVQIKDALKNVLIVSNHFPPEGLKAIELMRARGISVETLGLSFGNQKLVSPDMIKKADVVVSIGKTVQFALLANTPVYIYDHFGGPGYLIDSNYTKAMKHNFSGRGFEVKKSAEQIVKELMSDFVNAQNEIVKISHDYGDDFLMSKKLNQVLETVMQRKLTPLSVSNSEWQAMIASNTLIRRTFLYFMESKSLGGVATDLKNRLDIADDKIIGLNKSLDDTRLEIQNLNYRLNRFPVHMIDGLLSVLLAQKWMRSFLNFVRGRN